MADERTATRFLDRLAALATPERAARYARYFSTESGEYGEGDILIGVGTPPIRSLAKDFVGMPAAELETLLESAIYQARLGALIVMSDEGRRQRTTDERRRELFELYLRRTDRINNWDLVDVSCRDVLGRYLENRPRDILYQLAVSPTLWERRIAMVSTGHFIRSGDTVDALAIARLLIGDGHHLIHKATGWMLREVGDIDQLALLAFLDAHAPTMPRTALRYSIEKFTPADRAHYLGLRAARRLAL